MFFFFNDTATTEIYTLSLHDALPISDRDPGRDEGQRDRRRVQHDRDLPLEVATHRLAQLRARSEEHTSELQSLAYLVCRLLLEKKKNQLHRIAHPVARGEVAATGVLP